MMDFLKRLVGTIFHRGRPVPLAPKSKAPAKEHAKVIKRLSSGQRDRLLHRFGSGRGRYWPSGKKSRKDGSQGGLGTAIADGRGWYKKAHNKPAHAIAG